ncbi:MAG: nucleotidyltransferase family protein, partial [Pseudomonadota bacterium]
SCPIESRRDIDAATKYLRSVILIHPNDGVAIEVSKDLDKGLGLFPNILIFEDLETFDLRGRNLPTLSTEMNLCYVSYHSSRHTWSRLHWVADLDAIVRHDSFSKEKTRALAKDRGMLPLIDACLVLNAVLASPKSLDELSATPRGPAELIELSFANLEGDLDLEKALSNPHGPGGLPMPELFDRKTKARLRLKSIDQKIRPDFVQYYNYPLPKSLQWLYFLSRPWRALRRRFLGETHWIRPR